MLVKKVYTGSFLIEGWKVIWPIQKAFLTDKCPYQPAEAPSLIYGKPANKLFFDNIWPTILTLVFHKDCWSCMVNKPKGLKPVNSDQMADRHM